MKQKQINKVIELWRKAKQESIGYDVNGIDNGINFSLAKDKFIEKLEKAKYECVGDGAYKLVFSKKSVDFVVKIYHNRSIDDKTDERFKLAKFFIKPTYSDGVISIQQKAKRTNKNKAYKFFEDLFGKDYCELHDIHQDNIGWLNNKPVIFDFVACMG